jgi:hypothetical protein
MGADGHAELLGSNKGARHDVRVAGMHAAGDVGRTHDRQDRVIVAHLPCAEAFAEIGVEVHGPQPGSRVHRNAR